MKDETAPPFEPETTGDTKREKPSESHIFNLSARAFIAVMVIGTVCYMSIAGTDVKEPLYTLAGLIAGFFFGQATKPKSQSITT